METRLAKATMFNEYKLHSHDDLNRALKLQNLSPAKLLLTNGAPVNGTHFIFHRIDDIDKSVHVAETAAIFYQRCFEFYLAFYAKKVKPFFDNLFKPEYCGKSANFFARLQSTDVANEHQRHFEIHNRGKAVFEAFEQCYQKIWRQNDNAKISLKDKIKALQASYKQLIEGLLDEDFIGIFSSKKLQCLYAQFITNDANDDGQTIAKYLAGEITLKPSTVEGLDHFELHEMTAADSPKPAEVKK